MPRSLRVLDVMNRTMIGVGILAMFAGGALLTGRPTPPQDGEWAPYVILLVGGGLAILLGVIGIAVLLGARGVIEALRADATGIDPADVCRGEDA